MGGVSDADLAQLILVEVNGQGDSDLANNVATLWALYAEKALVAPRLQYLYAKRHALDFRIGRLSAQVDLLLGTDKIVQEQEVQHLRQMRADVEAEIKVVETRARANRTPTVGKITAREPQPPWPDAPDPSDSLYRGDARKPDAILRE